MNKYKYSVIRFVPSPIRGEFINIGLLIGSDVTGEWFIDVSTRTKAQKIVDDDTYSQVASEAQLLQSLVESYSDPDLLDPPFDLSEDWLAGLSRDSQNQLQFSMPSAVLGDSVNDAFDKLWSRLVFEQSPTRRSSITKANITSQYVRALQSLNLGERHIKRRANLETSSTHAAVDVAVHNGIVKDITQCWSLQIKNADLLLTDIKAWCWTIKTLRERGGRLRTRAGSFDVPKDVDVGIVYAPTDVKEVSEEANEVFSDPDIDASVVTLGDVGNRAKSAALLLSNQSTLDLDD